jgi:TolB-like protein
LIAFNLISRRNVNADIAKLEKSIAVLPLINDSPDESNAYFINGIMENILDNLCKIQNLTVIARTSVEQYRNAPKNVTEIAKELKVSFILEGSGQKYEDRIRLIVQLINGENGKHIWSNQYNRELKDIFSIQSEVSQVIASELKAIITLYWAIIKRHINIGQNMLKEPREWVCN